MPRKFIAGNWKMNGSAELLSGLSSLDAHADAVEVVVCPPFPFLTAAQAASDGTQVKTGAQDCHAAASGAHTGDVSAPMLAELGVTHVILGHSERRAAYAETDAQIAAKVAAAQSAGLTAILCLGESAAEREAGATQSVVTAQIDAITATGPDPEALVVAYEPIWAIGTGAVATEAQIAEVHAWLRARLVAAFDEKADAVPLLYGGSVKAANAPGIFALSDVDGALVGGASLKPADFAPIIDALAAA